MRRLGLVLLIVLIAILQYLYGNAISFFLTMLISACIVYFLAQVTITKFITSKLNQNGTPSNEMLRSAQHVKKKYNTWLPALLMITVFISSLFCLKVIVNPGGKNPYFTNNQYHAIANKAIAFDKFMSFRVPGSEENENYTVKINRQGEENKVILAGMYTPMYKKNSAGYTVANNIFPRPITHNFSILNKSTILEVSIKDLGKNWKSIFSKKAKSKQQYTVHIRSTDSLFQQDVNSNKGSLTFTRNSLSEGMSLYNLMLNNQNDENSTADAYALLERVLQDIGDTYLLTNYENDKTYYTIFPSQKFIRNGYQLKINDALQKPILKQSFNIADNQNFYFDFHQRGHAMKIAKSNKLGYEASAKKAALVFENPSYYRLTNPTEDAVGNKAFRFITNSEEEVINTAYNEGYLFQNHGLTFTEKASGLINFSCGKPNTPLQYEINDKAHPSTAINEWTNTFQLSAESTDFIFEMKDFSQNGFSYTYLLLFTALLFLLFSAVLIFFPGKKLSRIEPIIFAVIYGMFVLRFILSWRIATFPPLENISKFELENTLIGFDFSFMGINLPLPFSMLIIIGLVIALIIYRVKGDKMRVPNFLNSFLQFSLTKQHLMATLACVLIYFVNKFTIKAEVIFRVASIILPLILYLFYSLKLNEQFKNPAKPTYLFKFRILNYLRDFVYYFINNPTFKISLVTFTSFALTDKGFAVLFALFVLLKNILLHFLKNTYSSKQDSSLKLFFKPSSFWIYGILAFIIYLVVIGFKSAFYYALLYKVPLLFVVSLLTAVAFYLLHPTARKKNILVFIPAAILFIVVLVPSLHKKTNAFLDRPVRHVKARASIIHQPIGNLIEQNEYSSYQAQKVIASAESQWFINTFITKKLDRNKSINLQPHTKVGVNYSTQTRDVVLARYVIGELGNFTMYLILLLFVLPLIIYLLSYKMQKEKGLFIKDSYGVLIPFLLLLTLALFVWLTATNRFVFFGQDFPFLSITSRVSVLLPLLLFFATLLLKPEEQRAQQLDVSGGFLRYTLLLIPIGIVAIFTTLRNNDLKNENFNVVAEQTENFIQKDFNGLLQHVQDSLSKKTKNISYETLVEATKASTLYQELKTDSAKSTFTKSLLSQWEKKPGMARKINSPLYIISDNGRYSAEYNKNLYLHLPTTDSKNTWNGSITESTYNNSKEVVFQQNNETRKIALPAYIPNPGITAVLCPASWFVGKQSAVGLADIRNQYGGKATLLLYKFKRKNIKQKANSFVSTFEEKDAVIAQSGKKTFHISFKNSGNIFADNKWLNSQYRIIYPLHEQNFWVYHFSHALRSVYSNDSSSHKDLAINLDYNLEKNVYQNIRGTYNNKKTKRNSKFKFSAIAADGSGNIRLIQDLVSNRKTIDPNDQRSIYNLEQKHFFFSNTRNERDQWGNTNLMTMSLGPGSSIKPLAYAAAASSVNAGWEKLVWYPSGADQKTYAGFKLDKDWKNDEHYFPQELNPVGYIEASSNFYHSIIMFLSSYKKSAFQTENSYSITKILSSNKTSNSFPRIGFGGREYRLPSYRHKKNNWPKTANNEFSKSYFGNENSILCDGLEWNANLRVTDKDKNDFTPASYTHINFSDSNLYNALEKKSSSAYLWSYPEASYFLQSLRTYNEINQNFNLGFKTPTLGGYPYQISPYKMLEMYSSLCLQNRNYKLKMIPNTSATIPWKIDSSWLGEKNSETNNAKNYYEFLAAHVFTGMKNVVTGGAGTARRLQGIGGDNYFVYAKTGTINEQGSGSQNSRRLIVVLANKDLTQAENIGKAKTYSFYFTIENARDFDWALLKNIIKSAMNSTSFINYFKNKNGQ